MPFWLKSKALTWANPERAPSRHSSNPYLHARRRQGRRATPLLPGPSIQDLVLEPLVAYYCQSPSTCIPEEILGLSRKLPAGSSWNTGCSPRSRQKKVGQRSRQVASTVKQASTEVMGRLLCAHYGRDREHTPYSRKASQTERTTCCSTGTFAEARACQ